MDTTTNIDSIRKRITIALFSAQGLFSGAVIVAFTLTSIIAFDLSGSETKAGWPPGST